jgi:hypothetical protein
LALDKQYCIYGIDTSAFYFEDERNVEQKMYEIRNQKKQYKILLEDKTLCNAVRFVLEKKYKTISKQLTTLKETLLSMMRGNMNRYRFINPLKLNPHNRISIFDSELTRCFGMTPLNLNVRQTVENTTVNEQIMVISVFYFEVLENMIHNGFYYNGNKYVYFASSAGQIRTKKAVFVREDLLDLNWNRLSCGLSIEEVNQKGGMNLNKYNAYLALCNSATEEWTDFDIDRCIVVDDFETNVVTEVDYVDDRDYSITRQTMPVPIPHTDGCGMISPELSSKNFMVRLPWTKGLLGVFDFKRFITENKCSSKVKDIWDKEWDIFEDNIQIILTKSQLKMCAYYDSWDDYKERFKKYNCHAGKCNVEEDYYKRASINYQMIQSFIDYKDSELKKMCAESVNFINGICSDKNTQLEVFGIKEGKPYSKYNGMQKCLIEYNGLIKDNYFREQLRDLRKKKIKDLYSAKFKVNGYYTFLLPDLYAFCEWLFMNKQIPNGLLAGGEVYCKLHEFNKEVDCLRSPHLYFEHAIRNNVVNPDIQKWFTTNACYTSTHDVISKVLQFDVDGDKTLILQDNNIINVAKRNQVGVVPLYYNMRKAAKEKVTSESRYRGLSTAFTGGNIGVVSNNISKIKNSEEIRNPQKKQEAIDCLKWLCMVNNEVIDFAKTLYKSTPPKQVNEIISKYVNKKLPAFFTYAKDKKETQVEELNDCIVNRIFTLYPENEFKLSFEDKKRFDYRMLMNNPDIEVDENVLRAYSDIVSNIKLKKHKEEESNVVIIGDVITALQKFDYAQFEICDMLIKDMFKDKVVFKDDRNKDIFFHVYGDIVYENIVANKPKYGYVCIDCGADINRVNGKCRCEECQKKYRLKYIVSKNKERRNKMITTENV